MWGILRFICSTRQGTPQPGAASAPAGPTRSQEDRICKHGPPSIGQEQGPGGSVSDKGDSHGGALPQSVARNTDPCVLRTS